MSYRRVDVHSFVRYGAALFLAAVFQRAHIVQAVGKLDYYNANILTHSEQYLTDILGFLLFFGKYFHLAQLCNAIYEHSYIAAELLFKLLQCALCIFHNVMQQCGANSVGIHSKLQQDIRY